MFEKIDQKQSFPKLEEEILTFWEKHKIFEASVEMRSKDNEYVFYDGPPFATGLPHYGHILAGTMKDVVPRYWTMRGHRVERVFGWDCHGLPVEYQIEKELGINGKQDIEKKLGIAKFNEECRKNVLRYTKEWEKTVKRMGRWVDFKNAYSTMDPEYMESIWWVFKTLWDKKLIFEGNKSMHICPRCVTSLSNFEVTLNYQDVHDISVYVKFRSKDDPDLYFLAWTTTPWTLPGNAALAVHPDIDYVEIGVEGKERYILAKSIYDKWDKDPSTAPRAYKIWSENDDDRVHWLVYKTMKGSTLAGKKYEPLFEFYKNAQLENIENVWTVVEADFVETEEGTGIVHTAPAFGEEDLNLGKEKKLPFIQHVNIDGTMKEEVADFAGEYVKDVDEKIIKALEQKNLLYDHEKFQHSYPFCWRCETALLNYSMKSWFVNVDAIKEKMIESNQDIHWMPGHLKDGRFGKWLENARDWCISRNRYWGTPLPIWKCEQCEHTICIGSREELEKLSGKKVEDLHKHFVDEITFSCEKCEQGEMCRVTEVLDCWFESGSMPYAQKHYPFENKEWLERNYPADFIAEGLDQTRGWFYTLHVLATALSPEIGSNEIKPAFKNVIVNGIVLAEDGNKMSKSKKNYPDPHETFDKYGADAVRFYLMNSTVVRAEDLRFSEKGVSDVVKNVMLPIWNAYGFFVMYANIDKWQPHSVIPDGKRNEGESLHSVIPDGKTSGARRSRSGISPKNKLDCWILSALHELIGEVTREMDNYDLQAIKPIYSFIQNLTNWYIRRSRRRFWKSENDDDKAEAYQTLYTVLVTLSKIIAPWMPFLSEAIYRNLTFCHHERKGGQILNLSPFSTGCPPSVHLCDWPEMNENLIDHELNEEFRITQLIVNLGRRARLKANIKIRQPLQKIEVVLPETISEEMLKEQLIAITEELNVKKIEFIKDASEIAVPFANPDARKLGPKYGAQVQEIIKTAKQGKFEKLENGNIKVLDFELLPDEISVGYKGKEDFDVEYEEGLVIALDTKITDALKQEGIARDIVRCIQDMRKEANYNVTDRIKIGIVCHSRREGEQSEPIPIGNLQEAVQNFSDYIKKETLANEITENLDNHDVEKDVVINDETITLKIKKL